MIKKIFLSVQFYFSIFGLTFCEDQACTHSWSSWTTTTAATCTTEGKQTRSCSLCGEEETKTINALGHNFVDGICTVCGEEE